MDNLLIVALRMVCVRYFMMSLIICIFLTCVAINELKVKILNEKVEKSSGVQ